MSSALLLTALTIASSSSDIDVDARLALGLASRLDQSAQGEIMFEFGGLGRIELDDGSSMTPTLLPEISLVLFARDKKRDDMGVVGFGYGWTAGPLVLGFVPGIVAGVFRDQDPDAPRRVGGGLRLMAIAELKYFVGLQAGYIGVYHGSGLRHEVYASVSVNFLGLAVMYILGR
jgi:hypothetical protein